MLQANVGYGVCITDTSSRWRRPSTGIWSLWKNGRRLRPARVQNMCTRKHPGKGRIV